MISCNDLKFSDFYANKRINHANTILGKKLVKKIIAFALYLLGVSRRSIADKLDMPCDTIKSFTTRIEKEGVPALVDRRYKGVLIPEYSSDHTPPQQIEAYYQNDYLLIDFGNSQKLHIPSKNRFQIQTILLTLLEDKQLSNLKVAELLGLSQDHVYKLRKNMLENDVPAFIDKRQGQQKEYVFNAEAKGEMIQQFVVNTVLGKKTTSEVLSQDINKRCNIKLSSRGIRSHLNKLGLHKIKKTLPNLIKEVKKTKKNNKYQ